MDISNNIWIYKRCLYISIKHCKVFIHEFYISLLYGYQRIIKTYERFKRHFDFLKNKSTVTNVVKNCEVYAKSKALKYKPYKELQALPIPDKA